MQDGALNDGLVTEADGPVTELLRREGRGEIVLTCEHASKRLPAALGDLGLDENAGRSHIAWDPGARALALLLSEALDAPLLMPRFSRLAYDCNRPPEREDAIAARSEGTVVPGNLGLTPEDRAARTRTFHDPFHGTLEALLQERLAAGRRPVLVTVHSFTPIFFGQTREVELGLLHDRDSRLADACLAVARDLSGGPKVARNQPYGPEDGVTYTLRKHALPKALPNLMIEVRNDLIAEETQLRTMAAWLQRLLELSLGKIAGWRLPERQNTAKLSSKALARFTEG